MALLITGVLPPCMARAQETPQDILKKAIARVARTTTYQCRGRLEVSGLPKGWPGSTKGTVSMQFIFIRSDNKTRMEMTRVINVNGHRHDIRVMETHDGKKYYMTDTGAPHGSFAWVSNDDKNFHTSSSLLPAVKDVQRWACKLLPVEMMDGKAVSPITVFDNEDDDKDGTTYYIEQGTYRLTRVESKRKSIKSGFALLPGTNEFTIVLENETLNGKLPSDAFTFVFPTNAKQMTGHSNTSNALASAMELSLIPLFADHQ
jgi:hypothetical protein